MTLKLVYFLSAVAGSSLAYFGFGKSAEACWFGYALAITLAYFTHTEKAEANQ